jgi:Spy/CpxP family protein refolding chaperone
LKTIFASAFALGLLAASAVPAAALTIHIGPSHHHHHRHCTSWGWHHHHHDRYCRGWGW